MIGVSFFALAACLAAEGVHDLAVQARPRQPVAGLAVTAAALVGHAILAIAKRRTGQAPR
jgi:divalent metal cation (Fe/Co/Zn/Cd) transporter